MLSLYTARIEILICGDLFLLQLYYKYSFESEDTHHEKYNEEAHNIHLQRQRVLHLEERAEDDLRKALQILGH